MNTDMMRATASYLETISPIAGQILKNAADVIDEKQPTSADQVTFTMKEIIREGLDYQKHRYERALKGTISEHKIFEGNDIVAHFLDRLSAIAIKKMGRTIRIEVPVKDHDVKEGSSLEFGVQVFTEDDRLILDTMHYRPIPEGSEYRRLRVRLFVEFEDGQEDSDERGT